MIIMRAIVKDDDNASVITDIDGMIVERERERGTEKMKFAMDHFHIWLLHPLIFNNYLPTTFFRSYFHLFAET